MKYTLLELTQNILSSMESDEVDSIYDSPEAMAVAVIVRGAYYDLVTRLKLPAQYDVFSLVQSADQTTPVVMYLPSNIEHIDWIRYDKTPLGATKKFIDKVEFLPIDDFMSLTYNYATTQNATTSYTISGAGNSTLTTYCLTNQAPLYYTTFDSSTLLFDGFDSTVDTYLSTAKTTCYGKLQMSFPLLDSFVPQLDEQQFQLLLNEAKGTAWFELKQTAHERAEKKVKQHLIASQYNKDVIGDTQSRFKATLPDYGRKR